MREQTPKRVSKYFGDPKVFYAASWVTRAGSISAKTIVTSLHRYIVNNQTQIKEKLLATAFAALVHLTLRNGIIYSHE